MLNIDGKSYTEEELTPETKMRLARLQVHQAELESMKLRASELEALINLYTNTIRETLAPSDSPE